MNTNSFRIDNIHIQNYKKYDSLELELKNNFMLIVGGNGSGKTTILDAIATLLGVYLQAFKNISSSEIHPIRKKDIKLDISDIDENVVTTYQTPIIIKGICNISTQKISLKRIKKSVKSNNILYKGVHKELLKMVKNLENNKDFILPIISYHGTGRLWEHESKNSSTMEGLTRLDGYKDCLNAMSNYRNFISWFKKQELNSFNLRKKIPILEAVRATVIEMMSILTEKELELFIYREGDLEIKYKDEKTREKVSNLSDGYRNMIGIVSDIAYRMAILNPSLGLEVTQKTSGVVLIDELDLHLHPKWQKRISSMLVELFPKVQFIVTSHSPFIIQTQMSGQIIRLDESHETLPVDATMLSIEDIAETIQHINLPQMSKRKADMLRVAEQYFDILEKFENNKTTKTELEEYKNQLDKLIEPYEDNMAYVAFLRRKRLLVENNL